MCLGVDIIDIERVRIAIARSGSALVNKIMTENERLYIGVAADNCPRFAGIWAAKEAAVKALGTGFNAGVLFHDIEIYHDDWGKPHYRFSGEFYRLMQLKEWKYSAVSISHCQTQAIAAAIFN